MVTLLAKIFIKDSEDKIKQREAYGMLCGVIGILFNETAIGISVLVKLVILAGYPFLLYKWHFYDKDEWNNLKGAWKKWSDLRRLKENVKNVKYRES